MAQDVATELRVFYQFIGEQVSNGAQLTPEECLRQWRVEHPTPAELEHSVAAVKRALEQAERGEAKSLDEFDREFRARHGISKDA